MLDAAHVRRMLAASLMFVALAVWYLIPKAAVETAGVLLICALCLVWRYHMRSASISPFWAWSFAIFLGIHLLILLPRASAAQAKTSLWTLACSFLAYFVLKNVFGARLNPGLQEVATASLLLSLAAFTRPAFVIFLGATSLVLWFKCRTEYGGTFTSLLLIYTPAALGVVATVLIHMLAPKTIGTLPAVTHLQWWEATSHIATVSISHRQLYPVVTFTLCVALVRLLERRSGLADLFLLGVLVAFVIAAHFRMQPEFATVGDICMIVYVGAMRLMALEAPERLCPL